MSDKTEETGGGGNASTLRYAAITADLPSIDFVFAELTGDWLAPRQMISCPLPGHDDSTPSFNLWAENDDGVPMRFGCFGCGRSGDVVDLINVMEYNNEDEDQALERAAQLRDEERKSPDRERPKYKRREPEEPLPDVWDKLLKEFGTREFDLLLRFFKEKGLEASDFEQFAVDEWDWTATRDRKIAMPHKDSSGKVVGIKYRAGDKKWNEPGSTFESLYGVWRDTGKPRVLLCEGETDTVWASFHLPDFDVFGLPSGVNQAIQPEWLNTLEGRELVLAFDGDKPGIDATRRWCARRPDALVARVPEGEDLVSCGIPITELVERATIPRRRVGGVQVKDGIFVRHSQKGDMPLADFAFEPERELDTDDGPAWEGKLTGDRRTLLIRASDLQSGSSITRWANKHGRAWVGGAGAGVQELFNWLGSESAFLPLERASTKAGRIGRSFVGPGFCIGADRVRYIAPALGDAKLDNKLNIRKGSWDARSLLALEQLNDPKLMAVVLGWLCASLLRGKQAPAPPLFVSGESGAGKTNLLATTLGAFGFETEMNLTTSTPYGVDCMVNSSIGFPVWFDEYRAGAREDSMQRLRQLLRDAYYGQSSLKGGMTSQATELTEVTTWAGIVVSGEMSSHETSHKDRIVMLNLETKNRDRNAYEFLQDERRTAGLGFDLLEFLARRPMQQFKVRPHGSKELPDRFRDTLGFVQEGWQAWTEFRWEQGLRDMPEAPDYEMLSGERAQSEDPWLEAIKVCEGQSDRNGNAIVSADGNGVTLIPSEVILEAKRVGIELPARANELVAWLRARYEVRDTRVGGTRRAKYVVGMELK